MARKPHRIPVKAHDRAPRGSHPRPHPMPGKTDFTADEEQAMRAGQRAARAPAAAPPPPSEPDEDDFDDIED